MDIELAKLSLLTAPTKPPSVLDDTLVVGEIWFDGQDVSNAAVTSATVAMASSVLTFTINGAADTRGAFDSSGQIDCTAAAYNTITELERAINAIDGWYFRALGTLVGGSTNAVLLDITETSCLEKCVKVYADTSEALFHGWCISNCAGIAIGCPPGTSAGNKKHAIYDERGARNALYYLKWTATLGGTATAVVYSINGATNTENAIGAYLPAANGVVNTLDLQEMPITANPGERLFFRIDDNTSLAITEASCIGKSIRT